MLASFSEYFDELFNGGNFEGEVRLEDVDADDFEAFLKVIVPPQLPINGMQINGILA